MTRSRFNEFLGEEQAEKIMDVIREVLVIAAVAATAAVAEHAIRALRVDEEKCLVEGLYEE